MKKSLSTWRPLSRSSTKGMQWRKWCNVFLPIRPNVWSFCLPTILTRTGETSLSHQVLVPLWWRSVNHGHSEGHLDHICTVHGCPFTQCLCPFLHGKEVTVWMMSFGALVSSPESYTQLAAEVQWQVTVIVLAGEAESTNSFADSRSHI